MQRENLVFKKSLSIKTNKKIYLNKNNQKNIENCDEGEHFFGFHKKRILIYIYAFPYICNMYLHRISLLYRPFHKTLPRSSAFCKLDLGKVL